MGTLDHSQNYYFSTPFCAHVIAKGEEIHKTTEAFRHDQPHKKYTIKVTRFSVDQDLAIAELCSQTNKEQVKISEHLLPSLDDVKQKDSISLFGFPAYKTGQTPYVADGNVASKFATHGIQKFEITTQIREGNSGGPVLNMKNEVVGIAAEGARKESGNNAVISISELSKVPEVVSGLLE
ncbi:MAG: hypothetical protein D3903_18325 [Candidatus Electrothrix sp. GM3_4]|nr:hypothetical protein [Candidatus Electrothrix sp. GM3_4]